MPNPAASPARRQPRPGIALAGRIDHARPWTEQDKQARDAYQADILDAADKRPEADRVLARLDKTAKDDPNRSHLWRLATLLRVRASQEAAEAVDSPWTPDGTVAQRWSRGAPVGDETEHLHRAAYLCNLLARRQDAPEAPLELDHLAGPVQDWLVREAPTLRAYHHEHLAPESPGTEGDGRQRPLGTYGWPGITWSLAYWLEQTPEAGPALLPLATILARSARDDRTWIRPPGRRNTWHRMTGCAVDLWEQRTGLSTGIDHGAKILLIGAAARSALASPRTTI